VQRGGPLPERNILFERLPEQQWGGCGGHTGSGRRGMRFGTLRWGDWDTLPAGREPNS